mmetsp:Transcript_14596/g.41654  ORF Transcript_14596/g.41654 Transcript_14596/m.41654 type:complete len:215 (-) Transcript_14596:633-1277(-)
MTPATIPWCRADTALERIPALIVKGTSPMNVRLWRIKANHLLLPLQKQIATFKAARQRLVTTMIMLSFFFTTERRKGINANCTTIPETPIISIKFAWSPVDQPFTNWRNWAAISWLPSEVIEPMHAIEARMRNVLDRKRDKTHLREPGSAILSLRALFSLVRLSGTNMDQTRASEKMTQATTPCVRAVPSRLRCGPTMTPNSISPSRMLMASVR